jgi:hypothetical protein
VSKANLLRPYFDMEYDYKPLHAGQIRFLRITQVEPNLKITIEEINLDSVPSYITISYCWESQSPTRGIVCNGLNLLVTENVNVILRTLFMFNPGRYFWIDADCIDQRNALEKAIQVPMMAEIYTPCEKSVAWLGSSVRLIRKAIIAIPQLEVDLTDFLSASTLEHFSHDLGLEYEFRQIYRGIEYLLNKPWFKRIWIVQEFVLPTNIEVLCGLDIIETGLLYTLLNSQAFRKFLEYTTPGFDNEESTLKTTINGFNIMSQLRATKSKAGHLWKGFAFSHVLFLLRAFSTSDPRDKVFGMLGMLEQFWRDNLLPDYSIGVTDLYTIVWELFVNNGDPVGLGLLNLVCPTNTFLGLPSWCPNLLTACDPYSLLWGIANRKTPLYKAGHSKTSRQVQETHSASDSRKEDVIPSINVPGFLLESVSNIVPPGFAFKDGKKYSAPESARWLSQCLEISRGVYADNVSLPTYMSTLVAGCPTTVGHPYYDAAKNHLELKTYFESAWKQELTLGTSFFLRSRIRAKSRSFFSTQNGTIGIGSSLVRTGDLIAIFHGGATPYIIRPLPQTSDCYTFLGETYVDGSMHGEAFEMNEAQPCKMKTFRLI